MFEASAKKPPSFTAGERKRKIPSIQMSVAFFEGSSPQQIFRYAKKGTRVKPCDCGQRENSFKFSFFWCWSLQALNNYSPGNEAITMHHGNRLLCSQESASLFKREKVALDTSSTSHLKHFMQRKLQDFLNSEAIPFFVPAGSDRKCRLPDGPENIVLSHAGRPHESTYRHVENVIAN